MVIPVTDRRLLDPEPESWLMYRRTYDGLGFSPLRQIDASNVVDLSPAWVFPTDGNDGDPQAPPIVNGRMMFVTTAEQVIALHAETGALLWRYVHPLPADVRRPHATNRGAALYGDRVYVGTLDARVVALEAATGRVRRPHATNRGVALYGDRVYVGTLDARVVALEAATGRLEAGGLPSHLLHHHGAAGGERHGHGRHLRRRARRPRIRHGARCRERR